MSFRPAITTHITIETIDYTFTEHPSARGMPYGQTGRRATVYQVQDVFGRFHALKVFSQSFRNAHNEQVAGRLQGYASLPGLQVCARRVLTPQRHPDLIHQYPDLSHAVLMPWVHGQTWQEIIVSKQFLSPDQSLALARGFATLLASMEQNGLAHCDLSGPNVIVPAVAPGMIPLVTLVDVEEMFGPGLDIPEKLPGGSSGYAHRTARAGLWQADADRFAGAILLSEMLAWCEPSIRQVSGAEQFFLDVELQTSNPKYNALGSTLARVWGQDVAQLFYRAWTSQNVNACPTFAEWTHFLGSASQNSPVSTPSDYQQISSAQHRSLPEQPIYIQPSSIQAKPNRVHSTIAPSRTSSAGSQSHPQQYKSSLHTPAPQKNSWIWPAITFMGVFICAVGLLFGMPAFFNVTAQANNQSHLPTFTQQPILPSPTLVRILPTDTNYPLPTPTLVAIEPSPIQLSCPSAEPQRVSINEIVEVCTKIDRLIVFRKPNRDSREIIRVYPKSVLRITGGPSCSDNSSWWRVVVPTGTKATIDQTALDDFFYTTQEFIGWVREGSDDRGYGPDWYYLRPQGSNLICQYQ